MSLVKSKRVNIRHDSPPQLAFTPMDNNWGTVHTECIQSIKVQTRRVQVKIEMDLFFLQSQVDIVATISTEEVELLVIPRVTEGSLTCDEAFGVKRNKSKWLYDLTRLDLFGANALLIKSRMRAVQHKCVPHLACINPTPLLFKKKIKFVTNSKNDSEILKKCFP